MTIAANAKLIAALEQEERRLRDNEHRYAEKIRTLSEELRVEREAAKLVGPLKEQLKTLTKESHTIAEELKTAKQLLERQATEHSASELRLAE
eukprot:jgi/Hompol1/291/HPOL_005273-RA